MKTHKVAREVKEQILNRIKNEGISVSQAAEEAESGLRQRKLSISFPTCCVLNIRHTKERSGSRISA